MNFLPFHRCMKACQLWLLKPWNLCLFLCALPFAVLFVLIPCGELGANPIEGFHLFTGIWSLRFMVITLMVTPVQTLTRWRGMPAFRQLFGLTSFFYAALHVVGYLWLDQGLIWSFIARDIIETPYIWPGLFAFVMLLLLALTSPTAGKKLLGRRWKKLHRWIYPTSIAIVLHYAMQLKGNLVDPLFYFICIVLLLVFRVGVWFKNRQLARLMIPRGRSLGYAEDESGVLAKTSSSAPIALENSWPK